MGLFSSILHKNEMVTRMSIQRRKYEITRISIQKRKYENHANRSLENKTKKKQDYVRESFDTETRV